MKNKFDPRHLKRQKIVQEIFAWSYEPSNTVSVASQEVINRLPEIDQIISQNAPKWPIEKINRIDISVLRMAVSEIQNDKDTPVKVIIDEAIELAKEFGSEASGSFVNGVLGSIIKNLGIPSHDSVSTGENSST